MNTVDGGFAADAGMGPVVVVAVDPGVIGRRPRSVRTVVVGVGPLERESAVEPFDLPIRLGPVRASVFVGDIPEGVVEDPGPVAFTVVARDP